MQASVILLLLLQPIISLPVLGSETIASAFKSCFGNSACLKVLHEDAVPLQHAVVAKNEAAPVLANVNAVTKEAAPVAALPIHDANYANRDARVMAGILQRSPSEVELHPWSKDSITLDLKEINAEMSYLERLIIDDQLSSHRPISTQLEIEYRTLQEKREELQDALKSISKVEEWLATASKSPMSSREEIEAISGKLDEIDRELTIKMDAYEAVQVNRASIGPVHDTSEMVSQIKDLITQHNALSKELEEAQQLEALEAKGNMRKDE